MSVNAGRDAYRRSRTPVTERAHDAETIKRSRVARGRARYAASRGDATARLALEPGDEGTEVDLGGDAA